MSMVLLLVGKRLSRKATMILAEFQCVKILIYLDPDVWSLKYWPENLVFEKCSSFWLLLFTLNSKLKSWLLIFRPLLFLQYGRILDIELKIPPRPPCYCFVEVGYVNICLLEPSLCPSLFVSWLSINHFELYCIQFENARDAEDAIRGRDGYNFDGCRLRVRRAQLNFLVLW